METFQKGGTAGIIQAKYLPGKRPDWHMVTLDQNLHQNGRFRRNRRWATAAAIAKTSLRIAAIGAVDEANSAIGIARLDAEDEMDAMLARIQNDLFDLGADLSVPEDGRKAEGALADRRLPRSSGWSARSTP